MLLYTRYSGLANEKSYQINWNVDINKTYGRRWWNRNTPKDEESKAIKVAKELKKEQRQPEQLNVDPEEVLEEQEKRQPQSSDE